MSDAIITVENLSKKYLVGHHASRRGRSNYVALRDVVGREILNYARKTIDVVRGRQVVQGDDVEEFWALKDVSFEVQSGEVLGIIGRNGAGKSTLLKILSRITEPTEGRVTLRGRVASLLEVGTGFHPELTGRENIFLNGAILGMTRAEIKRKFDEIVAFAEVEPFLDTPVKHYSSGMYVRLAFAVAAHLEPEVLIVDEVLAVGDAEFQEKCLGKMGDVARGGRTVLIVSHNMQSLSTLTQRCVLLERGKPVDDGPTGRIIARYLHRSGSSDLIYEKQNSSAAVPCIEGVRLHTSQGGNIQFHGDPMQIESRVSIPFAIRGARFEICASDGRGERILHIWQYDTKDTPLLRKPGVYDIRCQIPKLRLYAGRYSILIHLAESAGGKLFERLDGICPFEVIMPKPRDGGWLPDEGRYIEDAEWSTELHTGDIPVTAPDLLSVANSGR